MGNRGQAPVSLSTGSGNDPAPLRESWCPGPTQLVACSHAPPPYPPPGSLDLVTMSLRTRARPRPPARLRTVAIIGLAPLAIGFLSLALALALGLATIAGGAHATPNLHVAGVVHALPDDTPADGGAPGDLPDPTEAPPAPGTMSAPEMALLAETNRDRVAAGLAGLVPDPDLIPLARTRAADQVPLPTLSHLNSGGALAFLSLIQRAGLPHAVVGENLVRLPGPVATAPPRAERALMASPTHRANILDRRYGRLAVGMATGGAGRVIFAQLFRDGP